MKFIICLMAFFSTVCWSYDGMPSEQVERFFSDYSKHEYGKAIDQLFDKNPVMKEQMDKLSIVKQQMSTIEDLYGKYLGNENVHYEELSPSLTRIVQVAKHEFHPMIFEFYFYKPQEEWITSVSTFNDSFNYLNAKK